MRAESRLMGVLLGSSLGLGLSTGCDSIDQAKQAAEAAKVAVELAKESANASAEAKKAGDAAAAEAEAQIAPGTDPELAKQQIETARAIGAMQGLQNAGGAPVVNWRQLAPFLPDELGGFTADGKLNGKTTAAGGLKVTVVKRRYKSGDKRLHVQITDTAVNTVLRAPFRMAAVINEDSSEGYKKGSKIDGHTAIVEWNESRKRSKATLLVGDRYMVELKVDKAAEAGEAEGVAKALGLAKLAAVKADAAEAAG